MLSFPLASSSPPCGRRSSLCYLPEKPGRVAAEAAVVIHMLGTTAHWMANVDVSTIHLDIQETTVILTMQALGSALHFPHTHGVLEVFTVPVPSDGTGMLLGMDSSLDADPLHGTTQSQNDASIHEAHAISSGLPLEVQPHPPHQLGS
jgi:hypothetical protein